MKIYILVDVETKGIIEVELESYANEKKTEVYVTDLDAAEFLGGRSFYTKPQWTADKDEAVRIALEKIAKRKKKLQNELRIVEGIEQMILNKSGYSSNANGHGIS